MRMDNHHDESDDVESFLRRELEKAEEDLKVKEDALEPMREKVRKLRASLAEYTAGTRGSARIGDEQIVLFLKKNASEKSPLRAPEIAAMMGIDTRGISRRLPRMVGDGMIAGNSESGYFVAAARPAKR